MRKEPSLEEVKKLGELIDPILAKADPNEQSSILICILAGNMVKFSNSEQDAWRALSLVEQYLRQQFCENLDLAKRINFYDPR